MTYVKPDKEHSWIALRQKYMSRVTLKDFKSRFDIVRYVDDMAMQYHSPQTPRLSGIILNTFQNITDYNEVNEIVLETIDELEAEQREYFRSIRRKFDPDIHGIEGHVLPCIELSHYMARGNCYMVRRMIKKYATGLRPVKFCLHACTVHTRSATRPS